MHMLLILSGSAMAGLGSASDGVVVDRYQYQWSPKIREQFANSTSSLSGTDVPEHTSSHDGTASSIAWTTLFTGVPTTQSSNSSRSVTASIITVTVTQDYPEYDDDYEDEDEDSLTTPGNWSTIMTKTESDRSHTVYLTKSSHGSPENRTTGYHPDPAYTGHHNGSCSATTTVTSVSTLTKTVPVTICSTSCTDEPMFTGTYISATMPVPFPPFPPLSMPSFSQYTHSSEAPEAMSKGISGYDPIPRVSAKPDTPDGSSSDVSASLTLTISTTLSGTVTRTIVETATSLAELESSDQDPAYHYPPSLSSTSTCTSSLAMTTDADGSPIVLPIPAETGTPDESVYSPEFSVPGFTGTMSQPPAATVSEFPGMGRRIGISVYNLFAAFIIALLF